VTLVILVLLALHELYFRSKEEKAQPPQKKTGKKKR
jgi:low temperature requirement protein LtrA